VLDIYHLLVNDHDHYRPDSYTFSIVLKCLQRAGSETVTKYYRSVIETMTRTLPMESRGSRLYTSAISTCAVVGDITTAEPLWLAAKATYESGVMADHEFRFVEEAYKKLNARVNYHYGHHHHHHHHQDEGYKKGFVAQSQW